MYNLAPVFRRILLLLLVGLALAAPAGAQVESELLARRRVFPEIGAGLRAIKRDTAGHYYVLTAPGPAVLVYDAAGQRVGQIPSRVLKNL
jgi:hypothetical protein